MFFTYLKGCDFQRVLKFVSFYQKTIQAPIILCAIVATKLETATSMHKVLFVIVVSRLQIENCQL